MSRAIFLHQPLGIGDEPLTAVAVLVGLQARELERARYDRRCRTRR